MDAELNRTLGWTRWERSRCDDRRGFRTSLGGLEQSNPSYTHTHTDRQTKRLHHVR